MALALVERYEKRITTPMEPEIETLAYDPFNFSKRISQPINNIGGKQVPVVLADLSGVTELNQKTFKYIGHHSYVSSVL